jgi:uncharacterized membrane protein (DUF2068 family)
MVRGAVLREQVALRALAIERAVRGGVLLAAAYGVWRVQDVRTALDRVFSEDLPALKPVATEFADLFGGAPTVHLADAFAPARAALPWVSLGLLAYAFLRLAEACGLWFGRRWAIYLAVLLGALSVPLEIFALTTEVRWSALLALLIGAGLVGWLCYALRLFGLRGGRRAITRARRVEAMLEVVRAAGAAR